MLHGFQILNKSKIFFALIARGTSLFLNFGLAFFYSVLLSRLMSVSDRGEFYEYQVIALIGASFASLSIPQTVTVMVGEKRQVNLASFLMYLMLVVIFSALLPIGIILFLYPDKTFHLLFLMILGNALTTGFIDFFKVNKDFKSFSIAYSLIPAAGFLASFMLFLGVSPSLGNVIYLWVLFQLCLLYTSPSPRD